MVYNRSKYNSSKSLIEKKKTLANTYSINLVESSLEKKFVVAHVIF